MIEISDEKYWIKCTYPEMELYLRCLEIDGKIGWRIFKDSIERNEFFSEQPKSLIDLIPICPWYQEDHQLIEGIFICVPVRDNDCNCT